VSSGLGQGLLQAQCGPDEREDFAGDVAFEDPQGVLSAVTFFFAFFGEVADAGIVDHVVVRDGPQGVVGGAFTSEAEAVTLSLAAAGCTGLAPQSTATWTSRRHPLPRRRRLRTARHQPDRDGPPARSQAMVEASADFQPHVYPAFGDGFFNDTNRLPTMRMPQRWPGRSHSTSWLRR